MIPKGHYGEHPCRQCTNHSPSIGVQKRPVRDRSVVVLQFELKAASLGRRFRRDFSCSNQLSFLRLLRGDAERQPVDLIPN